MNVKIKEITNSEYLITKEWGGKTGFIVPEDVLPKVGFMSFVNEKPVFAAWMYCSDDGVMGFISYVVANPKSDNKERNLGFKPLIDSFEKKAKEKGLKCLFTTTNVASLATRMCESEFTVCDSDVVHLIKKVE